MQFVKKIRVGAGAKAGYRTSTGTYIFIATPEGIAEGGAIQITFEANGLTTLSWIASSAFGLLAMATGTYIFVIATPSTSLGLRGLGPKAQGRL
jgi:hypothetical protein